jgi:NADH-quinone oxidoreductase subunit E
MFENWTFLLGEIWVLLALAGSLGLFAGWIIWGQSPVVQAGDATQNGPLRLSTARGNQPDDLTKIKGIGPKLANVCNDLGFFHFDQIANWTAEDIKWVDQNLKGFQGRATRDNWIVQAQGLVN